MRHKTPCEYPSGYLKLRNHIMRPQTRTLAHLKYPLLPEEIFQLIDSFVPDYLVFFLNSKLTGKIEKIKLEFTLDQKDISFSEMYDEDQDNDAVIITFHDGTFIDNPLQFHPYGFSRSLTRVPSSYNSSRTRERHGPFQHHENIVLKLIITKCGYDGFFPMGNNLLLLAHTPKYSCRDWASNYTKYILFIASSNKRIQYLFRYYCELTVVSGLQLRFARTAERLGSEALVKKLDEPRRSRVQRARIMDQERVRIKHLPFSGPGILFVPKEHAPNLFIP